MIHFISRYFYTVQRNKVEMLTRDEKRKAWLTALGILACIAIVLFLWIK